MGLSDNGKVAHDDEYPYEDHIRSQAAFMVDGGQRKSSIMGYPNADGLNNYVVKNQRVVELVRPVVTRRVLVNGKPVREERIVGAYEDGNGLKENLDNLGKVKDFFGQIQMEASLPGAPILSRPSHNSRASPNWPSQNGANWGSRASWMSHDESPPRHNNGHFEVHRPNWGSRGSWMNRDDSPPRHNGRPFEVNRPNNGGIRSTYTTYDDSPPRYNQRNELSRPSLDTKPNWPSRSESPPGVMVQSRLVSYPNSAIRPKWPSSRDDSPPRLMAHPNSGARPNWPIRNDSPPRAMEYFDSHHNSNTRPNLAKARDDSPPRAMEYYESHPNSNTRPNWAKTRDDSPPQPIVNHSMPRANSGANKPNWSSNRDDSPPRTMEYYESQLKSNTRPNWAKPRDDSPPQPIVNHCMPRANSGANKPNWSSKRDDSPPRTMEYYESQPKSNTRPNWAKPRDDSPPKPIVNHSMTHANSGANNPNWSSNRDHSPPRSMMHPELNHPNLGTRPSWPIRNESPPRALEYSSHPKSNARPNWAKARDDSPPKSMVQQPMAHPNSDTSKPNWTSNHDYSPAKSTVHPQLSPLHSKLEKVNIHDSRGSSPIPNKMNADNARSGSNKESTQPVRESDQRPNWPNRKAQDGKEEHEKPKCNDGGHIKKGSESEIHGLANPKSVAAVEATTRISSTTQEIPKKLEDSYKKPSNNHHDNLDDGNSKKSSSITASSYTKGSAGNTKADFNGRWVKQPGSTLTSATSNVDDLMKVIEEAKRTGAYPTASEKPQWSEIAPTPPQGVRVSTPQWNEITPNPPVIDSMEARRRYTTGYPQPVVAPPMGYYGGALSSEDAVRIYGGTFLPS